MQFRVLVHVYCQRDVDITSNDWWRCFGEEDLRIRLSESNGCWRTSGWPQDDLKMTQYWMMHLIWLFITFYHPKMIQSYVSARIAWRSLVCAIRCSTLQAQNCDNVGTHSNFMGKAIVSGLLWFLEPPINVSIPSWATFLFKHEGFIGLSTA